MIDYKKVKAGDKLRITGMGAPGYAKLGDIVTVKSCSDHNHGRCLVVTEDGTEIGFLLTCGAQRLEVVDEQTDAEKLAELEALFDLCHDADMRAIKQWQAATGRTRTWPDQTALVLWLLGKLDEAEAAANVRTALGGNALFAKAGK